MVKPYWNTAIKAWNVQSVDNSCLYLLRRAKDNPSLHFGHLIQRADSLEKTLMLGRIEDKRRSRQQRMRWLDSIINSTDVNLSKLWETVDRRA